MEEQMSKVREELEKAIGMKQKKGQDDQAYMKKLSETIDVKLPDAEFDALSEEAQAWQNEAIEAIGSKDDIPDFPEDKPVKKGKKVEEEEEEEKPKKKAVSKKKVEEEPKKKVKKEGELGDSTKILHIICDDMDADVASIIKTASKKGLGLSESTIKIRFYITHEILKYLKENKRLKG